MNPDLDLTLQRVIRAPRAVVWRAWTDPSQLEQWWVPAPAVARVDRLEARPGGAFVTRISEDGVEFGPHMDASFLKHVRTLEANGLIRTTKSGRVRTCVLDRQRLALVEDWLAEQRRVWAERTDRLEQFVTDRTEGEQ